MQTTVNDRPAGAGRAAALAGGDVVALLVFAAIGRGSHGEASGLGAIGEVARTAAPFLAGWLIMAPWLGAFRPEATGGQVAMLRSTALAWCAAIVVGSLLRAALIGRFSPPSFYVVTFIAALALLGGWRAAFVAWERR